MPPTELKYTAGAERAAHAITQMSRFPVNKLDLAEIISRETHDAEMLEALKLAEIYIEDGAPLTALERIKAIIAKVEGR